MKFSASFETTSIRYSFRADPTAIITTTITPKQRMITGNIFRVLFLPRHLQDHLLEATARRAFWITQPNESRNDTPCGSFESTRSRDGYCWSCVCHCDSGGPFSYSCRIGTTLGTDDVPSGSSHYRVKVVVVLSAYLCIFDSELAHSISLESICATRRTADPFSFQNHVFSPISSQSWTPKVILTTLGSIGWPPLTVAASYTMLVALYKNACFMTKRMICKQYHHCGLGEWEYQALRILFQVHPRLDWPGRHRYPSRNGNCLGHWSTFDKVVIWDENEAQHNPIIHFRNHCIKLNF